MIDNFQDNSFASTPQQVCGGGGAIAVPGAGESIADVAMRNLENLMKPKATTDDKTPAKRVPLVAGIW